MEADIQILLKKANIRKKRTTTFSYSQLIVACFLVCFLETLTNGNNENVKAVKIKNVERAWKEKQLKQFTFQINLGAVRCS